MTGSMAQVLAGGEISIVTGNVIPSLFTLTNTISPNYLDSRTLSVYGNEFIIINSEYNEPNSTVYVSDDNITWTLSATIAMETWNVIWDGSQYIASGSAVSQGTTPPASPAYATSPDGITWSPVQVVATINTDVVTSFITYSGSQYVIVTETRAFISANLITWSGYTTNVLFNDPIKPPIYANGQYIAVGGLSTIITSPDAITWTSRSIPGVENFFLTQIIWDGSQYIAVGGATPTVLATDPLIITSPDGINWTQRSISGASPLPYTLLSGITKKGSEYLAVGEAYNGDYSVNIFYSVKSSDGISWTSISTIPNIGICGYGSVISSNSNYALIGYANGYNFDIVTVNATSI